MLRPTCGYNAWLLNNKEKTARGEREREVF